MSTILKAPCDSLGAEIDIVGGHEVRSVLCDSLLRFLELSRLSMFLFTQALQDYVLYKSRLPLFCSRSEAIQGLPKPRVCLCVSMFQANYRVIANKLHKTLRVLP